MKWRGVLPAMTTAFQPDLSVDHAFSGKYARWMVDEGCTGIVALGSLGESATLQFDEKVAILKTIVSALDGRARSWRVWLKWRAMSRRKCWTVRKRPASGFPAASITSVTWRRTVGRRW